MMHHNEPHERVHVPKLTPVVTGLVKVGPVPHHSISRSKPSLNMHHLQLDTEIRLPWKLDDEIGPTSAKFIGYSAY
jgi:hypothetical protein